jgi:1-acyl-sn-glycerol-3-phosphate acyltransferase
MADKVKYYSDENNDDFAGTNIDTCKLSADFTFINRNPLWRFCSFVLYRLIATPIVFLIGKIGFGLKIKNRKALKSLKNQGFYLYGNHTQAMMDAYTPSLATFPKRAHIIAGPDAVSIKGIRQIVMMLGGIPIPTSVDGYKSFLSAIDKRISQKRVVAIYPEAHIWPFYTKIRNFPDTSFTYPVSQNVPCVAMVTTYRQRKIFKKLYPLMTVTLSDPFYPDTSLSQKDARKKLRDDVYNFMCEVASSPDNYEYVKYIKNDDKSKKV